MAVVMEAASMAVVLLVLMAGAQGGPDITNRTGTVTVHFVDLLISILIILDFLF